MNIYLVSGMRHQMVAFGARPEDAVAEALASGEVGDWEMPAARAVEPPAGYVLRPARQTIELLQAAMGEGWATLRGRLEGLTDEEFFWEPAPGCWTVHQTADGRWTSDYAEPDPEPPPFTTIGWRLFHVASCKVMYHEYAFGPARLTWDKLPVPHTAAAAITWLEAGHDRLQAALDRLSDADLEELRLTNWGEPWPTWRIFWTMVFHDVHHGAEIGCLRDLYRVLHQSRL
ncbi:MAG: DinB family protein [Ardenticatenaceae bacterium]|nr:DinB family protein [Ardenticatenaceae bacterium]HBY93255.1 hypothetical protein [Chloroflexota bacterium]